MADDFKYHIDHHVGLVPPPELAAARADGLDGERLRQAEDAAIRDALRMQRRIGLSAVGDGQYRRRHALSVVYDNVDGLADAQPGAVAELVGARFAPQPRVLRDAPAARRRLARHEADFLTEATNQPLMMTLPAPGYLLAVCVDEDAQLAAVIRDEVVALAADGIAYVQLHNPVTGFLLTGAGRDRARALGIDAAALVERMVAADATVLSGLDVPENFRVGLDITTSGAVKGYDIAAVEDFLARQPFARLCVEYLAAEEGRFPIDRIPDGCVVALGVVDVSTPDAEPVDALLERVDKATTIMDVDDIAISTNGAVPPVLNAQQQRGKLQLVEMVARYFWGNEL